MSKHKLEILDANHLKSIFYNRGWDHVGRQKVELPDVFKAAKGMMVEDAMNTGDLQPLMPQTIVNIIKETQEPYLVTPRLFDRISYQAGQRITFPAIGALYAADVAEQQAYPEVQLQIGGATMTATVNKTGLAFAITEEVLRYSQWDILGLTMREAGKAMARAKEVKGFKYIRSVGIPTHDNIRPQDTLFGVMTGRNLDGSPNGSVTMDDIFNSYAQILHQGYMPNTMLMHPLTWTMWIRDPNLRAFALASGGGTFFASYSGNPQSRAPWENSSDGGLGMASGQRITPGASPSGDAATQQNDYSQMMTSAPNLPSYFPYPFTIIVSPFMPFDPDTMTTDIYLFDRSRLGAYIVDEELTTEEWDDPSVETRKVKLRERYGFGIYEEGLGISVMKNVSVKQNHIVLPAQAQISVSGSITEIDPSVPITF
jgi:hypothetical protein